MNENMNDDGSLSFLNIPRDEKSRSFNCDETTQSNLVNTSFWVMDFIEEVPTKFSKQKGTKGQTLVKISLERDSAESACKKFFTGSAEANQKINQAEPMPCRRKAEGMHTAQEGI